MIDDLLEHQVDICEIAVSDDTEGFKANRLVVVEACVDCRLIPRGSSRSKDHGRQQVENSFTVYFAGQVSMTPQTILAYRSWYQTNPNIFNPRDRFFTVQSANDVHELGEYTVVKATEYDSGA